MYGNANPHNHARLVALKVESSRGITQSKGIILYWNFPYLQLKAVKNYQIQRRLEPDEPWTIVLLTLTGQLFLPKWAFGNAQE